MHTNDLMHLLVCPKCQQTLVKQGNGLACATCKLLFPVHDEIPVLLIDQALPLSALPSDTSKD